MAGDITAYVTKQWRSGGFLVQPSSQLRKKSVLSIAPPPLHPPIPCAFPVLPLPSINTVLTLQGAWALMSFGLGRRTLYLYGLCGLFSMLMILGCLGIPSRINASQSTVDSASMATGVILLVWALCYQLTVGTVCYSLVAEISTRRLQIKTVALGRACYVSGIFSSFLNF